MSGWGDFVKQMRHSKGWNQRELASQLTQVGPESVTQATISNWENNHQVPDRSRLPAIAGAFATLFGIEKELAVQAALASPANPESTGADTLARPEADYVSKIATFRKNGVLRQDIEALTGDAKKVWAINPGALGLTTDSRFLDVWAEKILTRDRAFVVIWPLDVMTENDVHTATLRFADLDKALQKEKYSCESGGGVTHYGFVRAHVSAAEMYCRFCDELQSDSTRSNRAVRLSNKAPSNNTPDEDVGLRIVSWWNPALGELAELNARDNFDLVNEIDLACHGLDGFAHWGTAAVLYDTIPLRLNMYAVRVEAPRQEQSDGGLWRNAEQATRMHRCVSRFEEAFSALAENSPSKGN